MYMYNIVHCVLGGKGEVRFRNKDYEVKQGDVFFFSAYESHRYASDPSDPMSFLWVEFAGSNSVDISRHVINSHSPVQNGSVFDEAVTLCSAILNDERCNTMNTSLTLYYLLMVMCHLSDDTAKSASSHQQILDYVEQNLGSSISLTELAEKFGYHPNYFSSLFKEFSGMTFTEYLNRMRVSKACHLLLTTNDSLDYIASELCFYDTSHFIRRFKALEGITPSVYRKMFKPV